jgi:hypothetical protein
VSIHHRGTEGTEVHGDNNTYLFFSVPSVPLWGIDT